MIIGPLDGYPHFSQARPPPHQPHQGSTGPEVHPGRKLRCLQAPGSPEERQRVGPQANLIHARTSGLAAFTPGTQPFQTEMRAVAAPYGGPKVRSLELGARDCGVGKSGGRGTGTPAAGPASKCLPASRAGAAPPHLPQAGAPPGNARCAPPLPGPRQLARGADPERPCGLTGWETPG